MLTIDFDRLDVRPGMKMLDLGCGAGRHAFEAFRRGAHICALDYSHAELPPVRNLLWAMGEEGQAPSGTGYLCLQGDALRLPFPDAAFDRVVTSEVMEHVSDDRAALAELFRITAPGGMVAVTVPSWMPEKVCWALSAEYHAPLVAGGHVRIYTLAELQARMREAGFSPVGHHRAHALHSPYWWLKCAVGPTIEHHPLVQAYHRLLVWDISHAPAVTRVSERVLNPVLGKSLVVYARKVGGSASADT